VRLFVTLEIHNFTQNEIDEKSFQKTAEVAFKIINIKENTEISLAIVGDGRIRKLNKMYRGKNRVTDVLSFGHKPASPAGGSVIPYLAKAFPRLKKGQDWPAKGGSASGGNFISPPDGIQRLGEIIICYPRAKKQAKRAGHSLGKELAILLIHGILHLSGYDHEKSEQDAAKMEMMEQRILNKLRQN